MEMGERRKERGSGLKLKHRVIPSKLPNNNIYNHIKPFVPYPSKSHLPTLAQERESSSTQLLCPKQSSITNISFPHLPRYPGSLSAAFTVKAHPV